MKTENEILSEKKNLKESKGFIIPSQNITITKKNPPKKFIFAKATIFRHSISNIN